MAQRRRQAAAVPLRTSTLVVTNLIKIAGVVLALHEGFTTKDYVVIAMAGFMMAGAQASENLLLAMLDKILARPQPPEEP